MFGLRDLVSARTWLAIIHNLAGIFISAPVFIVVVFLLFTGVGLVPVALAGLLVLGMLLRLTDWFARVERARFWLLLGVQIPSWPPEDDLFRWWMLPRRRAFSRRDAWGNLGYALLRMPVSLVLGVVTLGVWPVGLVALTLPLYTSQLPNGGPELGGTVLRGVPTMTASVVIGLLILYIAPRLTCGLAGLDASFAHRMLAPPSDLTVRVAELERSREAVMDAAETERRRIERDLHDGAQQRLVALAMELGRAKARFGDDVDAARDLVDQAHEQAKAALTELRNLVRGVHPPVLTDRGLDAALSGLAALCPVPVELRVDVPVRPKATVEAIAYFMVAESLTNVAKHARASHVQVVVEGHGFPGTLTVMITDDGVGGANPNAPGLSGLAQRVAGVDGRFSVESPSGGPTIIAAVLPCG